MLKNVVVKSQDNLRMGMENQSFSGRGVAPNGIGSVNVCI